MKVNICPKTGDLSFTIDAKSQDEINQAVAFALLLRSGYSTEKQAPAVFVDPDEDADATDLLDLLSPGSANSVQRTAASVSDDDPPAGLYTREQRETWLYLRRRDRVRGVPLVSIAQRFKLSSTAASARACALVRMGYAVRVSKGYYRAAVPEED